MMDILTAGLIFGMFVIMGYFLKLSMDSNLDKFAKTITPIFDNMYQELIKEKNDNNDLRWEIKELKIFLKKYEDMYKSK